VKRLRIYKTLGFDAITAFVIKIVQRVAYLFLNLYFNLSLSQQKFPTLWKKSAIVSLKSIRASINNHKPISSLNNFWKIFEFIMHDSICYYFEPKSKSTVTNSVTYLDFVTPLIIYQRQAAAIYFDLSSAFELVPHFLCHHKLAHYDPSADYVNWFTSYPTNRLSHVHYSGALSSPFEVLSCVPQGSVRTIVI
jgi:hypothetical protein